MPGWSVVSLHPSVVATTYRAWKILHDQPCPHPAAHVQGLCAHAWGPGSPDPAQHLEVTDGSPAARITYPVPVRTFLLLGCCLLPFSTSRELLILKGSGPRAPPLESLSQPRNQPLLSLPPLPFLCQY